jgi:hypothetical protein
MNIHRKSTDVFEVSFEADIFRVLQLTDTHFSEDDKITNICNELLINDLLKRCSPNWIIHSGDMESDPDNLSRPLAGVSYFLESGMYWSLALGNHDPDGNEILESFQLSLNGLPVSSRAQATEKFVFGYYPSQERTEFCYRINIFQTNNFKPSLCIFVFDSGSGKGCYSQPRKVSGEQLKWFRMQVANDCSELINAPIMAIIHRPLLEYCRLSNANNGTFGERVCFDDDSGEVFSVLSSTDRKTYVLSGHDHSNSLSGIVSGVELIYGRKTGVGGYAPKDGRLGGRLFDFNLSTGSLDHKEVFSHPWDILVNPPTAFGCWRTIREGHNLIAMPNGSILDWIPRDGTWRLWRYDPNQLTDVFPGSPIAQGRFQNASLDQHLIAFKENYVLFWTRETGEWVLYLYSPNDASCMFSPIGHGTWKAISKDSQLILLNDTMFLNWQPKTGEWWLLQCNALWSDWNLSETPINAGRWGRISSGHILLPTDDNHILDWNPANGSWKLWRYCLSDQGDLLKRLPVFAGSWATINSGHELIRMPDGQILDWVPKSGRWRLWKYSLS